MNLWFSEFDQTLEYVRYAIPKRHRYRSVTLHCAPAAQNGDVLAILPAEEGMLSNIDIIPTTASGPCGMTINNNASLLESVLRGNLYVVLEPLDPSDAALRGQFLSP